MEGGTSILDSVVIEPLENAFDAVGAMEGSMAPMKRAAIGAGLGYALAYGLKPAVAFDSQGPLSFALTASQADKDAGRVTYVPAWAIILAPALIFSVFI